MAGLEEASTPFGAAAAAATGAGSAAAHAARPFALGNEAFRPSARLAGLERMGERLAQRIRTVVEPFARARTQVAAEPLETLRFEEWRAALPGFTSLSLYRLRPLKSGMLLAIDPDFVAWLVDAFYGGGGAPAKPKTREFTPTEERLLSRLADGIVEQLVEVWSEVVALTPALASRETNATYASLVRADEAVVLQRFTITPAQGRAAGVSILYPLGALRPYEALLAAKVHDEGGAGDAEWRMRLAEALETVRLPVRSVLARPELTLSQLVALKPGDVIPITLNPRVPLIVANRRIASGTIGEQDGRAALMIDHVERTVR
ncbi:flagellar motor switch protein FliM [Sphingomonas solaris]|uniref:Flagellar motor switch protein FliM n=2 Tax=Alterirhizorhabdus solaris TaxID=2529389 RepID=A0A558R1D5_9SPHN|nr:flagellar motor switch protein FliM [Sphingomonas solaris]